MQGTVDVLILRTLGWGPMHGYGIKTFLRDQTGGTITIESAALYQALHRLEKKDLVRAWWGVSESNRKAKYYELTAAGKRQLRSRTSTMREYVGALMRVLERFQNLGVLPRRVIAEFTTTDCMSIQVDISGLEENRMTLIAAKVGQIPSVSQSYWHYA